MFYQNLHKLTSLLALSCFCHSYAAYGQPAPEIKTENISANLIYCKLLIVDKDDPYGFIKNFSGDLGKPENRSISFSKDEDISLSLILLIRQLNKEVPVEWVVIWGNDLQGYAAGLSYNGTISMNASPYSPDVRFYIEPGGQRMTLFPLLSRPSKDVGRGVGRHHVSLYSFKVDGIDIKYPCSQKYIVE